MPTAPSKFTLSIFSPNNTEINGPNQTDINGLGVVSTHIQYVTSGDLESVASLDQKPSEFWLDSKGRLTDAEKNGTLRHAYIFESDEKENPIAAFIEFDQLNAGGDNTYTGPPVWLEWEITSDKFLVPSGKFKGLPWLFCQAEPYSRGGDGEDSNLAAGLGLGSPAQMNNCTNIDGLKVTGSD